MQPLQELRARRMIAQLLAPSAAHRGIGVDADTLYQETSAPIHVLNHLYAVQGQNYNAGVRAIALRAACSAETVLEGIHDYDIVRSWPMRGTLHFLTLKSSDSLYAAVAGRGAKPQTTYMHQCNFTLEDFERWRKHLHEALQTRGHLEPLTRTDLYAILDECGYSGPSSRRSHLIRLYGGEGTVLQGPLQGKEESFVHRDSIPVPRTKYERKQALVELGTRYICGHGPVTAEDLSWWAGITITDARYAFKHAHCTQNIVLGGQEYAIGSWQEGITDSELKVALNRKLILPAFDEYLLGYADKSFALREELRPQVLTRNGISWDFTLAVGEATEHAV